MVQEPGVTGTRMDQLKRGHYLSTIYYQEPLTSNITTLQEYTESFNYLISNLTIKIIQVLKGTNVSIIKLPQKGKTCYINLSIIKSWSDI